jgi:hypothetical protein
MKLTEQLTDYVNAAFTGLWINTHEPDEAEREIVRHANEQQWKLAVWDLANGLRVLTSKGLASADAAQSDPLAALRVLPAMSERNGTALLVLHNFQRFLNNPEIIQAVFAQLVAGKQRRTFIVVLSPIVQIPVELEKLFVILEHPLPDRAGLETILQQISKDPADWPKGDDLQRVLDAAAGLTRYEAEGAFSLSLTRHNAIRPETIWELKAQTLRKNNLLTLHRGGERFATLGGLGNLKDFCRRALATRKTVKARGVLLLGVPGSGKSCFARALGNEMGRPTLVLDVGALYGSLVGATEANVRQALRIADAMAPCILYTDELEKGLSGVGGQGDSGVSTRLFGTILTWLAEHESDVFFIGTANDISRLPPEFTRAERLDAVFFLDLPTTGEKDLIWDMYRTQFEIAKSQVKPDDTDWTGAEIRSCCRLAALLDMSLTQAAHHVVPVAITAAESVEKLRTWATGRCLNATAPGVYGREADEPAQPSRRLRRPSNN